MIFFDERVGTVGQTLSIVWNETSSITKITDLVLYSLKVTDLEFYSLKLTDLELFV